MDVYHSKIGDFWIEADGERVPFYLLFEYLKMYEIVDKKAPKYRSEKYEVLDRKRFKPILQANKFYSSIVLKCSIDLKTYEYVNEIYGDNSTGFDMINKNLDLHLGVAAYFDDSSELSNDGGDYWVDGGNFALGEMPGYYDVKDSSKCQFIMAFKKGANGVDISILKACQLDWYGDFFLNGDISISKVVLDVCKNLTEEEKRILLEDEDESHFYDPFWYPEYIRNNYDFDNYKYIIEPESAQAQAITYVRDQLRIDRLELN